MVVGGRQHRFHGGPQRLGLADKKFAAWRVWQRRHDEIDSRNPYAEGFGESVHAPYQDIREVKVNGDEVLTSNDREVRSPAG